MTLIYQKKDETYNDLVKWVERSGHFGNYWPRDLLPIILWATGNMYDITTGWDSNYIPLVICYKWQIIELFDYEKKSEYNSTLIPFIPKPDLSALKKHNIDKELLEIMENSIWLWHMRYEINQFISQKLQFKGSFTTFSKELSKESYKKLYGDIFNTIIQHADQKEPGLLWMIFNRYIIGWKSYPYISTWNNGDLIYWQDSKKITVKQSDIIASFFTLRDWISNQTTVKDREFNSCNIEGITISNEMNTRLSSVILDDKNQIIQSPLHIWWASMRNYANNNKAYQNFFSKMRSIVESKDLTPKTLGIIPAHFYRFFGSDPKHNEIIWEIIQITNDVNAYKKEKGEIFRTIKDHNIAHEQSTHINHQIKNEWEKLNKRFEELKHTRTTKHLSKTQIMWGDLHDPKISQIDMYENHKNNRELLMSHAQTAWSLTPEEAKQLSNQRRKTFDTK